MLSDSTETCFLAKQIFPALSDNINCLVNFFLVTFSLYNPICVQNVGVLHAVTL